MERGSNKNNFTKNKVFSLTLTGIIFFINSLIFAQVHSTTSSSIHTRLLTAETQLSVTCYTDKNFSGTDKNYGAGENKLSDKILSIKIPTGLVAVIYEFADDGGGYGKWVDLLENCSDLTQYLSGNISYINVFQAKNPQGFIWARNKNENGQFIAGHWERPRASGQSPNSNVAVVAPAIPPHASNVATVMNVQGANTTITTLGVQNTSDVLNWEHATNDQMGIIGSDFRGTEEVGSAAFERKFTGNLEGKVLDFFGASNINFWYPQKQKNDHRSIVYFKRTLSGKIDEVHQASIDEVLPDHDVNIDINPDPKYMYLKDDGHQPELTDITRIGLINSGEKDECPDTFPWIECEIDARQAAKDKLVSMLNDEVNNSLCLYGTWIYDKGHCCQPEIHPAEQIWWTKDEQNSKKYFCNVFSDASERFWWKDQMDDGQKLKPWGAPPIKGVFAIAFETTINEVANIGYTKKFEVNDIDYFNVNELTNTNDTYNLIYQGKTIVSFIPHNNDFKVSFENVGLAPGTTNKIRGFLVIETSVGTTTQVATKATEIKSGIVTVVDIPPDSDPLTIQQQFERQVFKKVAGHYMFSVTATDVNNQPITIGN
jgi:hypothetical protein